MNYLELLTDDNMDKILGLVTDDIYKNIIKLTNKVNKLNTKLNPLNIDKSYLNEENPEYLSIYYGKVIYCMNKYLYNNFNIKGDIILINLWVGSIYDGNSYISKKMKNPTYLDIMIESHKAFNYTSSEQHCFLEGLYEICYNKLYEYVGLNPKKNTRYFELILLS